MSFLGIERHYDRNGDGRLDAGEFARFEMGNEQPKRTVSFHVSLVLNVDLDESWEAMKHGLMALAPQRYEELLSQLAHTMLRAIACGLSLRQAMVSYEKQKELDAFLRRTPLLSDWTTKQLSQGIPYDQEAILTQDQVGTFWQALMEAMRDPDETDGFDALSWYLPLLTAYYHGVNNGEEDRLQAALETCFEHHWRPTLPDDAVEEEDDL